MQMPSFLQKNIEIGHYSGYRSVVHAQYFYELTHESQLSDLTQVYRFASHHNLPFLIISGGTNILFTKDTYPGVVVKNSLSGWSYDSKKKFLTSSSNERIWDIAVTLENTYQNPLWHRFIGLPGSIGGAVYGNAGCFGLFIENNFVSARIYDMSSGEITLFTKEHMGFAYRHSVLKERKHFFIIDAVFDLSKKVETYHSDVDNIDFRENKQPKGNSCGSFWKNPSRDLSAGSLIESVGLKGYRHGGARWSELHANFLLSDGESCKPSDLFELVMMTRAKVFEERHILMENEVQMIF